MVIDDLTGERDALRQALHRLAPGHYPDPQARPEKRPSDDGRPAAPELPPTPPALQASWQNNRIVLWAGSPSVPTVAAEELDRLMAEAGAGSITWEAHGGIPLPSGGKAVAVSAPVNDALGWLVGVGAGQLALDAGPACDGWAGWRCGPPSWRRRGGSCPVWWKPTPAEAAAGKADGPAPASTWCAGFRPCWSPSD